MNSSNDRRSNTPDGNGDPNASDKQEETDAEKEESDVIHEADDIERSTKTTEVEEDVSITMIRQTMHRLWETNDFLEESYKMDLELIHDALTRSELTTSTDVSRATDVVVELGLVPLFADIYEKSFYLDWTNQGGTPNLILINMHLVAGSLWNATDRSVLSCEQVVDAGLPRVILNYLNDEKLSTDRLNATGIHICVLLLLNILHNVVQKCDAARKAYRDASAVDILSKFRSALKVERKCVVSFTLAHIISEGESEKIHEDDDTISFVVNTLRQLYNVDERSRQGGFRVDELLEGLNNLAKNDANKERIVRLGALPLYTELLTIGNEREQRLACQGLWRLAFKCRDLINREPGCVEALQKLASCGEPEVSKEAKGALVRLEVNSHDAADAGKAGDNDGNESERVVVPMSKMRLNSPLDKEDDAKCSPKTSESGKEKGEDVYMNIIGQTMRRLCETQNYTTKSCRRDITLIENAMKPKSSRRIDIAITNTVVDLGVVHLFADLCRNAFYLDWSGPDGAQALTNMHLMAHIMMTATDRSADLCKQVVDTGLSGDILKHLNDPKLHPDRLSAKVVESVISRFLGILHNVVQKYDSARNAYREASAVEILPKFLSVEDVEIKRLITLTLACVAVEEGNNKEHVAPQDSTI